MKVSFVDTIPSAGSHFRSRKYEGVYSKLDKISDKKFLQVSFNSAKEAYYAAQSIRNVLNRHYKNKLSLVTRNKNVFIKPVSN